MTDSDRLEEDTEGGKKGDDNQAYTKQPESR